MNMNLKELMKGMGVQSGQVVSNPFARAFQPQVETIVKEEDDHEVSMANNSLDTIIKMATELKAKMGETEKDIPAWIQDHITNAENFISQASSNYHEYGQNESVNEAESDNVNWDVIENVFVNFLLKNTKELQRRVKAKHLDSTKSGIKSIISGLVNAQRSLKLESVNEGKFKKDELVYNTRTKTVGIVRMGDDKYGEVKTDADGNVNVDELEKYNPIKNKHQQNAKVAPSTEKEVNNRGLFNPFKSESIKEGRLTDIVRSIVETPVIGKAIGSRISEAKKYDVGAGYMGNGLTIWNRAEEEFGDYRIIAHIDSYGKISIRDKEIPSDVMKMIKDWAEAMKKGNK